MVPFYLTLFFVENWFSVLFLTNGKYKTEIQLFRTFSILKHLLHFQQNINNNFITTIENILGRHVKNTTKQLQEIAEIAGNRENCLVNCINCIKVNKTLKLRFMWVFESFFLMFMIFSLEMRGNIWGRIL